MDGFPTPDAALRDQFDREQRTLGNTPRDPLQGIELPLMVQPQYRDEVKRLDSLSREELEYEYRSILCTGFGGDRVKSLIAEVTRARFGCTLTDSIQQKVNSDPTILVVRS